MKRLRRHPDDRVIFALAVPALAALAADPLYSLVDTALVGHLGRNELGAVAVGTAAFTASFWLFSFLAYGVTPQVGRALGADDKRGAAEIGIQALFVAAAAGALIAVSGVLFAGPIVRLLGATGRVEELAETYLRIRILSAPFVLVALVGHGFMRGLQDARTPMVIATVGAAGNAVLDYVLIYPAGLGVAGAAVATLVAQAVVATWFLVTMKQHLAGAGRRIRPGVMRRLLRVGADLIVRTGSLLAALTLATSLAARMGTVVLGGWQIASQIFLLLSLTLDSLAIAAQALVARHLGAREDASARRVSNRLLEMGLALGVVLGIVLFTLRNPIAAVFTDDPEVQEQAARLIAWLAIAQPVAALAFTLDGILIGALATRFLAVSMLGASLLFAGIGLLAFANDWGPAGLAAGMGVWLLVRTLTTGARYRRPLEVRAVSKNDPMNEEPLKLL